MKLRQDFLRAATAITTLVVITCLNLVFITPTGAENIELASWTDPVEPTIKKVETLTSAEYLQRSGGQSNFPCTPEDTISRVVNPVNALLPPIDVTSSGCVTDTASGKYDWSDQAVIPYGSRYRQKLEDTTLSRTFYFGVENTNKLAVISNAYQFFQGGTPTLYITDDWTSTFSNFTVDAAGNVARNRSGNYDFVLKNSAGDPVDVRPNGLSFSANGRFVQAAVTNFSQVVIDLETKQVIPFAPYLGMDYAVYSKVSNDGRYTVLSKPYWGLKIYDLTKCQVATEEFASRDCESRDVLDNLKNYLGTNDLRVRNLGFVGADNALDVMAESQNADGSWSHGVYRMHLPNSTPEEYLALGDSFSSGEGAFDYVEATDAFVANDEYNVCHLSRKSYPYVLQEKLQTEWFHSIACSGSDSEDVIFTDKVSEYLENKSQAKIKISTDIGDQEDFLEQQAIGYLNSMQPGYVPQGRFVNRYSPTITTISMGGNDVGFEGMVSSCVFSGFTINQTCFSSREERESKANEIDQKISRWSQNFVDIKNSLGGSNPKLYVIGYPKIVSTDLRNKCGYNVPFDDIERMTTDRMIDYLNSAVKVAADAAGVRYVDISDAFTRAGDGLLCGPGPDFAANGLDLRSVINECTSATAPNPPACPNSFHPNALGHKLMAETIIAKTAGLSQEMPQNSNSMADLIDKRMAFVGDVAITLQNHRITFQKDIAPELIVKGEKIQINLPKFSSDLPVKQGSSATVIVHSTPRVLGQLSIAADGTVSGEVTLPADIETGYHRLIISYIDIADTTVEKYMYFYAAQSTNDWDGDGVDNATDPCVSVAQSGVDQDEDGIDDACDGEYVKSAQVSQPENHMNTGNGSKNTPPDNVDERIINPGLVNNDGNLLDGLNDVNDIFNAPVNANSLQFVTRPSVDTGVYGENSELDSTQDGNLPIWLSLGAVVTVVSLASIGFTMVRRERS